MRRISIITIIAAICATFNAFAIDIPYTNLTYGVHWKWGLIDMDLAEANLSMYCNDNDFFGTIKGHSVPWEGRVYSIADTLQAQMSPSATDVQFVIGWYRKPKTDCTIPQTLPSQYRNTLGEGTLSADPSTMEAVDITANMLNIFYYARVLDFGSMQPGQTLTIPINYAGGNSQPMTITYTGTGTDGQWGDTYNITLEYYYQGAPTNTIINVAIAQDTRYPVSISADIRIGNVTMYLV